MAHNHLEQLLAEWYEYKGYIVKRNLQVGKRKKGGFECELDIVAFHPELKHLVHLEPSLDADSWAVREQRFSKKFAAEKKIYQNALSRPESSRSNRANCRAGFRRRRQPPHAGWRQTKNCRLLYGRNFHGIEKQKIGIRGCSGAVAHFTQFSIRQPVPRRGRESLERSDHRKIKYV